MTGRADPPGLLLLRNMPLDALDWSPPSGRRADYVKVFTGAENALVGIGAALGQPIGSREEKDGNLVHTLIPVQGSDKPLSNEGATDFGLHVEAVAVPLRLRPGDCAILHNRLVVHGRTRFAARYDGSDRHLLRLYVADSLWPLRAVATVSARIVRRSLTR